MAKKTFKASIEAPINSPAEFFISSASEAEQKPIEKTETKSKRLQLLVKPSILETLKQRAWEQHTSTNNLINQILEDYINQ